MSDELRQSPPSAQAAVGDEQQVGPALARIGRQQRETEGELDSAIPLLQSTLRVQSRGLGDDQRVAVIHD